jgi:glycosyltransferase involved in cell wall biosynthesis
VPAYNEAGRIVGVLQAIAAADLVDEIVVVTDGCSDTAAAEAFGVAARLEQTTTRTGQGKEMRVFELTTNIGKGGAMTYGALRTEADVLLFLDADLIGLKPEHANAMLEPMVHADPSHRADMTLGLFGAARGGLFGWWLGVCHRYYAALTGQRAIRRDVFLAVPDLTRSRFGVETAITRYVKHTWKLKVTNITLHNLTHPVKEEKIGVMRGLKHRVGMYSEIIGYLILDNLRNRASAQHRQQTLQMRQRFGSDKY